MVLSNKKLKQKLRATLVESMATSVATNASDNPLKQDLNHTPHSLKQLLDSGTQKHRLSKREKRRTLTRNGVELVSQINGDERREDKEVELGLEGRNKKKIKKRKREGDGVEEIKNIDLEKNNEVNKSNKKKKKKKKKSKQKTNKKNEEVNKGVDAVNEESTEKLVPETVKTNDSQAITDAATKVYVGGIPYYSTEDDICSYFDSCGSITEVDCMKFPESGKFRGIAIINFKTEAAAKRALAMDGSDMGGLFLKIQPYKTTRPKTSSDFAPESVEGYNRLYVGNLSWDVTEDDLRKLFSDCNISSIRFGTDKETGEFKGYAHVDFSDSLSLSLALKLDQKTVLERPVRIRCAVPKRKMETPLSNIAENSSKEKKIKRRKCYECGEMGHLSSSCSRKKTNDGVSSMAI